jgi:hypothetical protein
MLRKNLIMIKRAVLLAREREKKLKSQNLEQNTAAANPKSSYLIPYHQKKNEEALKGVREMQKQPLSREECIAQTKQLKEEAKDYLKPR